MATAAASLRLDLDGQFALMITYPNSHWPRLEVVKANGSSISGMLFISARGRFHDADSYHPQLPGLYAFRRYVGRGQSVAGRTIKGPTFDYSMAYWDGVRWHMRSDALPHSYAPVATEDLVHYEWKGIVDEHLSRAIMEDGGTP
jgi:hypothetical protein